VVDDGGDFDVAEDLAKEHAGPHRRVDEVLRPVDAKVFTLVPGAVGRVLFLNVELFAGRWVVGVTQIEVTLDLVGRNQISVGLLARSAIPAAGDRISAAGEQHVFGDLPTNALDAAGRTYPDQLL